MSQHYYQTRSAEGVAVQVLAGWDRPLGHFFLVVEQVAPEDMGEEPLYSNLDDPAGGLAQVDSFAYYRGVLASMGIALPAAMVEAIESDKAENVGNRVKDWTQESRE